MKFRKFSKRESTDPSPSVGSVWIRLWGILCRGIDLDFYVCFNLLYCHSLKITKKEENLAHSSVRLKKVMHWTFYLDILLTTNKLEFCAERRLGWGFCLKCSMTSQLVLRSCTSKGIVSSTADARLKLSALRSQLDWLLNFWQKDQKIYKELL